MTETTQPNLQLSEYLKWAHFKRNEILRDIDISFKEAKDLRLVPDTEYSYDDTGDILSGICTDVKGDIQSSVQRLVHHNALAMRQMCMQAEEILLDLHIDVSQLENQYHMAAMAKLEEAALKADKSLKPLNPITSDAALQHAMGSLKSLKDKAEERFRKLQLQCTNFLKEKTEIGEELENVKAELAALKAKTGITSSGVRPTTPSSSSTTTKNDTQGNSEVGSTNPHQIPPVKSIVSEQEVQHYKEQTDILRKELDLAQSKLKGELEKSVKLEKELTIKVTTTTPFKNMKKMLQQKNGQMRRCRSVFDKYCAEHAEELEAIMNEK